MAKRVLLFTGNGKGKTTAAMGMALRAAGHGMSVSILQFIKNDSSTGELEAFTTFKNVAITQHGLGFIPDRTSSAYAAHAEAAGHGLRVAAEELSGGRRDLVVLDEICFAVSRELVPEHEVLGLIEKAADGSIIILTGRGATEALIAAADTVTEMRCVKHGYAAGIGAQKGVEF